MKALYSAQPEKAWKLGKGPFIFSGSSPACTGSLELINISDQKVKVRAIPTVQKKNKKAVQAFDVVHLTASIAPLTSVKTPAYFKIDHHTPSGIYNSSLSCGKQLEDVIIHVFDNRGFQIIPQSVWLHGSAGETLSHRLVIRNTGNVSLSLPAVSLVWLEEQDWVGRTFVYALRGSPETEGYEKFLDRVLKEFRSEMIPSTRVLLESRQSEIRPGNVTDLSVKLTLPKQLKKGKMYMGFMKLAERRLWFYIECNNAFKSKKRRQK